MKKAIIFILLFLLSTALIISNPLIAQKEDADQDSFKQIAYVDMQQLFQNHPQKKSSEEELENEAEKLKEELRNKAQTMDKEARQQLLEEYQSQLSKEEEELVNNVLTDINQKINQVAQERNISLVLDKSAVIYGGENLTAVVLEEIKADYTENKSK